MKQERRDILQIDTQMSNWHSILPEVIWSNLMEDPELLGSKAEDIYLYPHLPPRTPLVSGGPQTLTIAVLALAMCLRFKPVGTSCGSGGGST